MYFIIKYTKINSILNNLQVYQIFLNMNPLFKKNGWMNEEILIDFQQETTIKTTWNDILCQIQDKYSTIIGENENNS